MLTLVADDEVGMVDCLSKGRRAVSVYPLVLSVHKRNHDLLSVK